MVGGRVCSAHGGMAPQVRAAAERRWLLEHLNARQERAMAKSLGRALNGLELAILWYYHSADPATWRRHRRTRTAGQPGA